MNSKFLNLAFLSLLFSLFSCGGGGASADDNDSATQDTVTSAAYIVGDALAEGNSYSTAFLRGVQSASKNRGIIRPQTACSASSLAFDPTCGTSTATRTLAMPADGCTIGSADAITLYGSVVLAYAPAASCVGFASASSGTLTRTFTGFYAKGTLGYKVLTYTGEETIAEKELSADDLKDWEGTSRSGGTTITKTGAGTREVSISGVHRRGLRANGKFGFWVTTYTADGSPLTVASSGSDHTVTGTLVVAHNNLKANYTTTFTDVVYLSDGSCCYPTGGSIVQSIGGTDHTMEFTSTCGTVTFDTVEATLPACGAASTSGT